MSGSSSTPYHSFAKVFTSYHEQYAEAGPSSSQLDSVLRRDVVLDEEGGLITSLMRSIEEMSVSLHDKEALRIGQS